MAIILRRSQLQIRKKKPKIRMMIDQKPKPSAGAPLRFDNDDHQPMISTVLLPFDIIIDILSRLPVQSLLRFRSTNKAWCALIDSPHFINQHLTMITQSNYPKPPCFVSESSKDMKYHLYNHDHVDIILEDDQMMILPAASAVWSSRDGLLCIKKKQQQLILDQDYKQLPSTYNYSYRVLNPAKRKWIHLPNPTLLHADFCQLIRVQSAHDYYEYKILLMSSFNYNQIGSGSNYCEIISLNNINRDEQAVMNVSWRKVELQVMDRSSGDDHLIGSCVDPMLANPLVNGSLYWLHQSFSGTNYKAEYVVGFDAKEEKFRRIQLPNSLCSSSNSSCYRDHEVCVAEFDGFLCLLHFDVLNKVMDFWKYKDCSKYSEKFHDHGDHGFWVKEHSVSCESIFGEAVMDQMKSGKSSSLRIFVSCLGSTNLMNSNGEVFLKVSGVAGGFMGGELPLMEFVVAYSPKYKRFRRIDQYCGVTGETVGNSVVGLYLESLI